MILVHRLLDLVIQKEQDRHLFFFSGAISWLFGDGMANVRRFVPSRCAGAFVYAVLELKLINKLPKVKCTGAFAWDGNKWR